MEAVMAIARQYRLKVIEDATESLGSYYSSGTYQRKFTGTLGDVGVYSFNGNKIITTGGGGMIVTNNKVLAQKAKYLTNQAKDDPVRYIHRQIGYNFRLTNLQAALGLAQLKKLKNFIHTKKDNYALYCKLLNSIKGLRMLAAPGGTNPNYWFYSLLVDRKEFGIDREKLMLGLAKRKIQARPIWYLNHWQEPYRVNQAYKIENAPQFWKITLNLPCSTGLEERQVVYIASVIRKLGRRN